MLAYAKEPMGYTQVGAKRVYGKYYAYGSFGPTEIKWKDFRAHRDILEECPITTRWLNKKFNLDIKEEIIFRYEETYSYMSFSHMIVIAKALGIPYIKSRNSTTSEKRALRRAVIARIEGEYK